ncbi:unnamed protein product [Rhizophagus irregularis]|nr:unnamed protein product [Rhizophagus irregularis]
MTLTTLVECLRLFGFFGLEQRDGDDKRGCGGATVCALRENFGVFLGSETDEDLLEALGSLVVKLGLIALVSDFLDGLLLTALPNGLDCLTGDFSFNVLNFLFGLKDL